MRIVKFLLKQPPTDQLETGIDPVRYKLSTRLRFWFAEQHNKAVGISAAAPNAKTLVHAKTINVHKLMR